MRPGKQEGSRPQLIPAFPQLHFSDFKRLLQDDEIRANKEAEIGDYDGKKVTRLTFRSLPLSRLLPPRSSCFFLRRRCMAFASGQSATPRRCRR